MIPALSKPMLSAGHIPAEGAVQRLAECERELTAARSELDQAQAELRSLRAARAEPRPAAGRAGEAGAADDPDPGAQRQREEKLLRTQRVESVGLLAAGIAHDLNNILTPIGMVATLLRRRLAGTPDLRLLNTLEQSANRGADLVRQILGFMHGISGEPRVVQLRHLLRDVTAVITQTFPRSIVLEDQVMADLWPIKGNPTHIHQVVLNLCVNARDAMPQGGRLELRAANCRLDAATVAEIPGARPGAWVVLHVGDSGTGIPPDVLARMWEPFFTTKSAEGGTGLGLSTVRGIVESHHGFIDVRTVVGRGTLFRVFLPAAEAIAPCAEGAGETAPGAGRGERILVVDDEESIRDTLCEILTAADYEVVTAVDGAKAAAVLAAGLDRLALVITDYDMPGLDGGRVAERIRAEYPEIKVLVISGLLGRGSQRGNLPAGNVILAKPFSAATLLRTVEDLLHGTKGPAGG